MKHVAAAVTAAVTLVSGSAAVAHVEPVPSPSIHTRVLMPGELKGYFSIECPTTITSAGEWGAVASIPAAPLVRDGFVAGLREDLHSTRSAALAVSIVEQFASAEAASREARVARAAQASGRWSTVFSSGAYVYVVAGDPAERRVLADAARTLARRVHAE